MNSYQQYLSPNRSLLGTAGPGYEYQMGQDFPQHLRDWQQNNYQLPTPEMRPWAPQRFGARYRTPGGVPYQAPYRMPTPPGGQFNWGGYQPPQPVRNWGGISNIPGGGASYWGGGYQNALRYSQPSPYVGY